MPTITTKAFQKNSPKPLSKYQNIPVPPAVYARVRLIANSNNRGLGDQVAAWADRELPAACEHEKRVVNVQTFARQNDGLVLNLHRSGLYCPTCERVYESVDTTLTPAGEGVNLNMVARGSDSYLQNNGGK